MSKSCIIVTGAGGSIGTAITSHFAACGKRVIMACRNLSKDTPLRDNLNAQYDGEVEIKRLDLSSFDSIVAFAQSLQEDNYTIEALINNAGVMCKNYSTTSEGYETTIGVNFVGTVLLTKLLLPIMQENAHIVFTTSLTRYIGTVDTHFYDLTSRNYKRFKGYSRSKLATTLYAAHLAKQLANSKIYVNAADPGVVDTGMIHMDAWFDPLADRLFRPLISTPRQGALSAITAATAQVSGHIFEKERHHEIPKRLQHHKYAEWLINETTDRLEVWLQKNK